MWQLIFRIYFRARKAMCSQANNIKNYGKSISAKFKINSLIWSKDNHTLISLQINQIDKFLFDFANLRSSTFWLLYYGAWVYFRVTSHQCVSWFDLIPRCRHFPKFKGWLVSLELFQIQSCRESAIIRISKGQLESPDSNHWR